jgi:hypothetical protein
MLTYKQALSSLQNDHPDLKPTGLAYSYGDSFFIEMVDKNSATTAGVLDGYFEVNAKTGATKLYSPVLDGVHDPSKIKFIA